MSDSNAKVVSRASSSTLKDKLELTALLREAMISAEELARVGELTGVKNRRAVNDLSIPLTASFGVASGTESLEAVLQDADSALYLAKERGRNQVAVKTN